MANPNPAVKMDSTQSQELIQRRRELDAERRRKLTDKAVRVFSADFRKHGATAVKHARERNPLGYLQLVMSCLPRELTVNHGVSADFLSVLREANRLASLDSEGPGVPRLVDGQVIESDQVPDTVDQEQFDLDKQQIDADVVDADDGQHSQPVD